ncbi:uncharacterized protein LY89DRAFT_781098 [Mollisia scopiformis]|uniref:Uncharacterized protein n=1 Tax=Mollisia scopiformis TaxID=149040 RepID=A0A194XCU7_MOLSC|nr:uncharacterized protein LY89DRAFT_781098 [Mollisia scopiformis]KUJ17984.1 hypothetical protein LY89DRAFT_781098 [Mollisia scopiformis]
MPALAGKRGASYGSDTAPRHAEVDDVWIQEQTRSRRTQTGPEKFVMQYLTLKGLSAKEASKVREVVVVTHGQQLSKLLGKAYREQHFPNAKLRSYMVKTGIASGSLIHLRTERELDAQRVIQHDWAKEIQQQKEVKEMHARALISRQEKDKAEKAKAAKREQQKAKQEFRQKKGEHKRKSMHTETETPVTSTEEANNRPLLTAQVGRPNNITSWCEKRSQG